MSDSASDLQAGQPRSSVRTAEADAAGPRSAVRPWLVITLSYLAARLVTQGLFALASALAPANGRYGAKPDPVTFFFGWDAQWYWRIVFEGYPAELPRNVDGIVHQNAWAFMPVYPWLTQIVGLPFGSWIVGAAIVTLAAGLGACLVLYTMLRDRIGATAALWAVAFFAAGPLAGLFHVGYAESLFALWIFLIIRCVQTGRYGWLFPLVVLAGYTRPGVLAVALFLGLMLAVRWWGRARAPLTVGEGVRLGAASVLAAVVGLSWGPIAALVTGEPGAYLETELSWRRSWGVGEGAFLPFGGWFDGAWFWFRDVWHLPGWWGTVVAALIVLALGALLLWEPHVRKLGVEVRLWVASYSLYLLAVFFPQSSLFRMLFPAQPLYGAIAAPSIAGRSLAGWSLTAWRLGVLAVGLVLQWWWIWNMYALGTEFWQVP